MLSPLANTILRHLTSIGWLAEADIAGGRIVLAASKAGEVRVVRIDGDDERAEIQAATELAEVCGVEMGE